MGIVDRRLELLENITRLKRIGRNAENSGDLGPVRLALERELGATVSRRLAARFLGVSHTALERWIRRGDFPVVRSAAGREAIPVPALLDLYEMVEAEHADEPSRYRLSATMARQSRLADGLLFARDRPGRHRGHDRAHARSLAYHEAVASRLRKPMVREARHVLFRWLAEGRIASSYARRWERLLEMPITVIRREITAQGPDADDLRQNSPLAGLLSEPERRRILAEIRSGRCQHGRHV